MPRGIVSVTKLSHVNPILGPGPESSFRCPIRGNVHWESKDVFNPAATIYEGEVCLLYRAEDTEGIHAGTSRIGLATSQDGRNFQKHGQPVLYPCNDFMREYEWEGGCEDPRIVWSDQHGFVMTYSAFDGKVARLCVATSPNLREWTKRGLAFKKMPDLWSKAGAIICRLVGDKLVPEMIHGKYWMFWGESYVFVATSTNLLDWEPVKHEDAYHPTFALGMPTSPNVQPHYQDADLGCAYPERHALIPALRPRKGRFDSELVEPGPPAIITEDGILLIYHGKNLVNDGDPSLRPHTYSVGAALFDLNDPSSLLSRPLEPFMTPTEEHETLGQIENVCFAEGLVRFQDEWLLYYGTADSGIAMATAMLPNLSSQTSSENPKGAFDA